MDRRCRIRREVKGTSPRDVVVAIGGSGGAAADGKIGGAVLRAKPGEDAGEVGRHRAVADSQLRGNGPVAVAGGEQTQDPGLARAEWRM
jgi:hypothetical protein